MRVLSHSLDEKSIIIITGEGITIKITTILLALLVFSALIFIHELGHFIAARLFKVNVQEFALGMGPKILSRRSKKSGILYSWRLFPIGGFVSMEGEDSDSDDENAFCNKAVWKRMIITFAGAFMNILLGFLIMSVLVSSQEYVYTTTINRFDETAVSSASGLQEGDVILKVGSTRVHVISELSYEIMRQGNRPIDMVVKRGNETQTLEDVRFPTELISGTEYGIMDFETVIVENGIGNIIKNSWYQSISTVKMIVDSLVDLITGRYGVSDLSGPVGVTSVIGEAAEAGSYNLFYICVFISMNLGVFNLLPLPALDGGRLLFQIIELIRRKPIKRDVEAYIHFIGIVLLMILMIFVTYKDIRMFF